MRALHLVTGFAVLAGCARRDAEPAGVPAEVAYALFLPIGTDGDVNGEGELRAWAPDAPLPLFAGAEDAVLLYGWSAAQLRTIDALDPAGARVSKAPDTPCAPLLPQPLWLAELTGGDVRARDPAEAPRLTAPTLEICGPGGEYSVGLVGCGTCRPEIRPGRGCRFELDFAACGEGRIDAVSLPQGGACVVTGASTAWQCDHSAPEPYASDTADCTGPAGTCRLSLYPLGPPPVEVHELIRWDAPPYEPIEALVTGIVPPTAFQSGWATGLEVFTREIIVVSTGTVAAKSCAEDGNRPGELRVHDLDSGRLVATASVPPCLYPTRLDPVGQGFIGVFRDDDAFRIGRFGRDGRVVASERLPNGGSAFGPLTAQPVLLEEVTTVLMVIFGGPHARVLSIDRASFLTTGTLPLPNPRITRAATLSTQTMVVAGGNTVTWLDVTSFRVGRSAELPIDDQMRSADGVYWVSETKDRVRVLARPPSALYAFDETGSRLLSQAAPLDERGFTLDRSIRNWPALDLEAVFGHRRGPTGIETFLFIYDRLAERFRPGAWRVGSGIVSAVRFDGANRAYLLFPWSATVVRLTPRR